jgi:hypothetical protein
MVIVISPPNGLTMIHLIPGKSSTAQSAERRKSNMRKHITAAITTVCFVIGLYAGDWARNKYITRSK